jgi:hypothetical protein
MFLGMGIAAAFSQAQPKALSLNIETGIWQPHSLNDEPRFNTFGAAGATPFTSISLSYKFRSDYALRLSFGYWALRDLEEVEKVHSLTLHPLCLDLKYWLLPDLKLSPFVMYGGGIIWGVENETTPLGDQLNSARTGWSVNLGGGLDLALSGKLGAGLIFQYYLVRFSENLGGVEDFSGPKITGVLHVYF